MGQAGILEAFVKPRPPLAMDPAELGNKGFRGRHFLIVRY
jgi:hypothetical protein